VSDLLNDVSVKAVLFDYGKVLSGPEKAESWHGMRYLLGLSEEKFREIYWTYRDDYDRGAASVRLRGSFSVGEAATRDADRTHA
jgi:hypothetical protein